MAHRELSIELAGEQLLIDPLRALVWPAQRTAFLADLHLGKSDVFRRAGIPIPEGNTSSDLDRLETLVVRRALRRIVLLGDFLHGRSSSEASYAKLFAQWRCSHEQLEFVVVAGNHDRFDAFRPNQWNITWTPEGMRTGPFICRHHPEASANGFVLSGHVHPVMFLYGSARERLRVPVLWVREGCAILPSFGSFTGGAEVSPSEADAIYAFGADRIWEVSRR